MEQGFQFVYDQLFSYYGPQEWWPAQTPFEMMLGAILVQHTNWHNASKAIEQLRPYMEPKQIEKMSVNELAQLIRSSGYYNSKARRIKSYMEWFRQYDYDIGRIKRQEPGHLREELLRIYGVGRETADVILLYAFDIPIFVADAYARRIFMRLGYHIPKSYDEFRIQVEKALPQNIKLYNEYHALLNKHAKVHCKTAALCKGCPLHSICIYIDGKP
nr:endonuclease [uncultured Bacillus sp.]